jgi:hypothetical protein
MKDQWFGAAQARAMTFATGTMQAIRFSARVTQRDGITNGVKIEQRLLSTLQPICRSARGQGAGASN